MARKIRIENPGFHHIVNRGVNRRTQCGNVIQVQCGNLIQVQAINLSVCTDQVASPETHWRAVSFACLFGTIIWSADYAEHRKHATGTDCSG